MILAACLLACSCRSKTAPAPTSTQPAVHEATRSRTPWPNVARGVAWDANWENKADWYGTPNAEKSLDRLKGLNGNWIAVTPFSFQEKVDQPRIRFRERWSAGLDVDIQKAHARNMKVLVKPHIWSNQFWDGSGHWRGTIAMKSEADWKIWFENYTRWIVNSARLAQTQKADAFCVGLEYLASSRAHADAWRKVIREVRKVFHGPVVYAAHLDELDLPFWDELDAIGVNAYYPVSAGNEPTHEEMKKAWVRIGQDLQKLSGRFGRPIVFTEIGFASIDGAAREPFRWPTEKDVQDHGEQAAAYTALFEVAPTWPWFAGMFIWKFKIGVERNNPAERAFVFQSKPAEQVVKAGFGRKYAKDQPSR